MSDKGDRLPEQYCSTVHPKQSAKSDDGSGSSWKRSGVSVSTKSLPSSSSYDSTSLYDSGRTDSGFLSGANILSSEQYLSEEITTPDLPTSSHSKSKELFPELSGEIKCEDKIMRLDSGVDVELYDQFSSLSLKDSPINDLNSSSIKTKSSDSTSCSVNIISHYDSSDISSLNFGSVLDDTVKKSTSSPLSLPWGIYFQQDEDGDTQLHIAILHCFIEVVYSLIRMVPHPKYLDLKNDICQTPLHLAVLTGQPHIVRWLLSEGASPDVLDRNGNTALHLAVSMQDIKCVNALTSPVVTDSQNTYGRSSAPVYINRYNYDGLTCLHLAVMGGDVDIVKYLLSYGANVNAKEYKSGLTPLHMAIEMGKEDLCQFLTMFCLDNIDLEVTTYAGVTPYQLARKTNPEFAIRLRQLGAKWYPDDSDYDSEFDEVDSDDDDDDQMLGQQQQLYNSIRMNGGNGIVNVTA